MKTQISISKGTKVLTKNGVVELLDSVDTEAIRQRDGGYVYSIGAHEYYVSGGCAIVDKKPEYHYRHKDGLVFFA